MEINLSKLIISLIKIFVYIHTYFLPLFFTVRLVLYKRYVYTVVLYKYKTIYEYNIVSNYLGKKTASSRSILAFEVEKQKLENLKKRKTVFYYLITYTTSYKNIHIYIYIYISLYEENRYLQVNKNDYARCVMYGLSGDMEQHEFLKTEQ